MSSVTTLTQQITMAGVQRTATLASAHKASARCRLASRRAFTPAKLAVSSRGAAVSRQRVVRVSAA
eukprot:7809876-Pyramimonas_sp.AAC.1